MGTCVTSEIGVTEGNRVTPNGVRSNCVGVKSGVEVFVFSPTKVGVVVKVGVGTVGVKVGASVGMFVIVNVGTAVEVGGIPKNSPTVMEQAESNTAKIKRTEIFFM
jgi:hypothetical protein